MTRPRSSCKVYFCPKVRQFAPSGPGLKNVQAITLTAAEAESLRLRHIKNLQQIAAAKHMGISQSTFQRIFASASKKVSEALLTGKAITFLLPEGRLKKRVKKKYKNK